ncbi:MAG: DNA/RNA non-specific endonuclease, partial [Lachnospiraceae bacterium]|nr:DNA/RNA non-specific endonuclease [Lachnospiraceae bacterium]
GAWKDLEEQVRDLAAQKGRVYVVCGPIVAADYQTIGCNKHYINPHTGKKLKKKDYKPIKLSKELLWIAETRAAEAAVVNSHTRPNGTLCFTTKYGGVQSWGEVLAWNSSGMTKGIKQWYAEKNDWVKKNKNAVTGHYTQMIDPNNKFIGLACFRLTEGGYYAVSGEFSSYDLKKASSGTKGKRNQIMEITSSKVKIVTDNIKLALNETKAIDIDVTIGGIKSGKLYKADSMTIANDNVVEMTSDGKLKSVGVGNTKLTVTYGGVTKDIYVSVE